MLKKLENIILEAGVTLDAAEDIPPFEILNPDPSINYWHLVTDETQLDSLQEAEAPNLIYALQATTQEVCNQLKVIGSKVRMVSSAPAAELDLCDALIAQRFTISITAVDEQISYSNFLLNHYTEGKTKEEISENLLTVCEHISWYQNAFEREAIAVEVSKKTKTAKATVLKEINAFIYAREEKVQKLDDGDMALPAWLNGDMREFYLLQGWVSRLDSLNNTGIYFSTGNGPKRLTNFVLIPLIHVYTQDENGNRRLTELNNGMLKPVIQLPSKAFTSMETFDSIITSEGNFYTFDGFTKSHLNKIKSYYLGEYPKCYELNTLGWQPEGFFSFSNVIFKEGLIEYNKYGFAEIGDFNYLSMSASNVLEGVRGDDDIYKNDKFLKYMQSPIDFAAWCKLMTQVYPEHGMMAIVFVMMTVFRDILFKRNNNFPLLYFYGPVGSGKSKIGESVANVFTLNMPMFNLSNGTDFAFFSLLSRFTNVAVGLNEFDENTIKDNWFTAIKGAYDGEGRPKGLGKGNKTTTQAINVAIVMIGQFLSTKDDNSVLTRTFPCKITEDSNRTAAKIALYDELKRYEKQGLSSLICELLQHRQFMTDYFIPKFGAVSAELKAALDKDGIPAKNRIIENYSVALTVAKLMGEKFDLNFDYEQFLEYCKKEISKLCSVMSESNSLGQFWKTVEFLLDQNIIESGFHFRVETRNDVRLSIDRKTAQAKAFSEPKKLLFLRLGTVHSLYMAEIRRQTGKSGQNEQTIITYMKDQDSYIGTNPTSRFSRTNGESASTSSYVFDYDLLGVNLERFKDDNLKTEHLTGKVFKDAIIEEVIGEPKLSFTLVQDESYNDQTGNKVTKLVYTTCFSADTTHIHALKRDREIKITGTLNEQRTSDRVFRRMTVTNIEVLEPTLPFTRPDSEVNEIF